MSTIAGLSKAIAAALQPIAGLSAITAGFAFKPPTGLSDAIAAALQPIADLNAITAGFAFKPPTGLSDAIAAACKPIADLNAITAAFRIQDSLTSLVDWDEALRNLEHDLLGRERSNADGAAIGLGDPIWRARRVLRVTIELAMYAAIALAIQAEERFKEILDYLGVVLLVWEISEWFRGRDDE